MKNWLLFTAICIFGVISVITLASIAPDLAARQALFVGLSLAAFIGVQHIPLTFITENKWLWYGITNALLLWLLVVGVSTRNTARWIYLGPISIQPSQLAVATTGLLIAYYVSTRSLTNVKQLVTTLALMTIPAVLILLEPDLGSTIIFLASLAPIFLFKKLSIKHISLGALTALVIAIIGWTLVLQPYQKARIYSFLDPSSDPTGSAYNARQSLIAVGSGELYGRGLGQGIQSHLRFLPEKHTDFFFASFAEEYGFVGSIVLLTLYIWMFMYLILNARHLPHPGSQLFVLITVTFLALQTGINIGMNSGVFPITGITLPFLSYGGSSFLTTTVLLALCQKFFSATQKRPNMHIA